MSIHWQTILEFGRAFRSGTVSPVEVTRLLLDRIDRLDGKLHAFVHRNADTALVAATAGPSLLGLLDSATAVDGLTLDAVHEA